MEKVHVFDVHAQVACQMFVDRHLTTCSTNGARFARRHLTEEVVKDRLIPVGDGVDLYHVAWTGVAHVAGVLSEGTFVFSDTGENFAFDNDLRARWHLKVQRLAAD